MQKEMMGYDNGEMILENDSEFSISQSNRGIQKLLDRKTRPLACATCGKDLTGIFVSAYEHDGGWDIPGFFNRYWLSIECVCGYHTSFDKLGIRRS